MARQAIFKHGLISLASAAGNTGPNNWVDPGALGGS
jgi:hypothetical protein